MEKTDAMIMLMTLYNRLSESGISKIAVENAFKQKVQAFQDAGHIQKLDAQVAMAYLIPDYREKVVEEIKNEAIENYKANEARENSGYSKSANVDKINSLIDGALQNKTIKSWKPPKQVDVDPCSCSSYRVSSC